MSLQNEQALTRGERPPLIDMQRHALFLDLDGTLLEIEQRPDLVASDQALRALLRELSVRMGGALAVVSGRTIDDVDGILQRTVPCVAGLHGQEHRIDNHRSTLAPSKAIQAAMTTVRKLTAGGAMDVLVEDKGAGIALHYRRAPEQGEFVRRAADEIAAIHGLKVLHGKLVAELVPAHASKGRAISTLIREPPFAGRAPVAVGDDVTDEDAFEASIALGGIGVHVGAPRATLAAYRLPGVMAVKSWLLASLGRVLP